MWNIGLKQLCVTVTHHLRQRQLQQSELPPKNGDGQLKFICVDKKADKITHELKSIHVIKTMAVLEVMIVKMWLRELEKDYKTMTWLCCVSEHCIVSCTVLFAKI